MIFIIQVVNVNIGLFFTLALEQDIDGIRGTKMITCLQPPFHIL